MTNRFRFLGLLMALILVFSVVMLEFARGPGKQNGIVVAAAQNSPTVATAPVVATSDHNNFDSNLIAIAGYAPETVGVVTTTGRRLSSTRAKRSNFAGNYDTANTPDIGAHTYNQPRRGVLRT